jgi:predicted Zn-dependent protease
MRRRLSPWIVHRETVRLAVLIVVVAAVFAVTRSVAQSRRAADRADAVAWHARGGAALADGRLEEAAAAFRRAVSLQPDEGVYALSLADALLRAGNSDAAARVLLRMRDQAPDDAAVNTALARLSAARHDLPGASAITTTRSTRRGRRARSHASCASSSSASCSTAVTAAALSPS